MALARLFEADQDGHLRFGWSGHSLHPARHDDLLARPVRFRDYIMEGFLAYYVQAEDLGPGRLLSFRGDGSNRDRFIRPQVRHFHRGGGAHHHIAPARAEAGTGPRHFIAAAGLTITVESDD